MRAVKRGDEVPMATLVTLDGVTPTIGARAMLAAGAVVSERMEIPPGVLAAGVPARVKKELSGSAQHWVQNAAADYQRRRRLYQESSTVADAG